MKVEMMLIREGNEFSLQYCDYELPSRFIIRGRKGNRNMYGGYRDTTDEALEKAFELVSRWRFYDGEPYTVEITDTTTNEVLYRVVDVNRDEVLVKDFTDGNEYTMLHYRDNPRSALLNFKFTKDFESHGGSLGLMIAK